MTDWLHVTIGSAPLIISIPHAGAIIPHDIIGLVSQDLARRDGDHHVDRLYEFAAKLGATIIHSAISRTVIDLNRDPSGQSLYPGQATTGLCPVTTFDGQPLYVAGAEPDPSEIAQRRATYFEPYNTALADQIARLRALQPAIVVYDAHSIRSHVPRLFEGKLPQFNIGSFNGASCSAQLTDAIKDVCADQTHVLNGRFKGGWITRHYGKPKDGVHAVQIELAMRGYCNEQGPWPPPWDAPRAAPLQATLHKILTTCLDFLEDQR